MLARLVGSALILVGTGCSYDFSRSWTDAPPIPRDSGPPLPIDEASLPPPADAGPPPDVPPPPADAPQVPDPPDQVPVFCFDGKDNAGTAECPAGWAAIAGAGDCVKSMRRSVPSGSGAGWRISCGGGTPLYTEVICVKDGSGLRRVTASAAASGTATAVCASWEVAMGGGCACDSGNLWLHDRQQAPEGWACACTGGAPTAHVACLHQASAKLIGRTVERVTGGNGEEPEVRCKGHFVVTGGCSSDRELVGGGLGDTDDAWRCVFQGAATNATLTAICLPAPLGACTL